MALSQRWPCRSDGVDNDAPVARKYRLPANTA
jgi:hypothetical protein